MTDTYRILLEHSIYANQSHLSHALDNIQGKRRSRILTGQDINTFLNLIHTGFYRKIKMYSPDGFVPVNYKYRAPITWIEWTHDNPLYVRIGVSDAKRSHGQGSIRLFNKKIGVSIA